MKNKFKSTIDEIKNLEKYVSEIKSLEKEAINDETKHQSILKKLEDMKSEIENIERTFGLETLLEKIEFKRIISKIDKAINKLKKGPTNVKYVNMDWLKSKTAKRAGFVLTSFAGVCTLATLTNSCGQTEPEMVSASASSLEAGFNPNEELENSEEADKAENELENKTQSEKEDEIIDLVKDLTAKFNEFEGLNVTEEQVLSLFIHLNVGNSYMNDNDLALDKLTREDLVKKYYVGLTPELEEFNQYQIVDDDLSKLTANVMEIRNELNNYIIVLNDQGKYEESRKILDILNGFITEKELQDEASVLIESVQNIQTNDKKEIKKQAYLWYNYLYAGPKSEVRNFNDYGCYKDIDEKEMTFENQGMTIRFLTWFLNVCVDTSISGKEIIPQDIINDAQAKLLDQSNLLRSLGYRNCTSFASIYGIVSDEPLTNGKKTKTSSSKSKSNTSKSKTDSEIDSFLKENSSVGSSFTASDGSTVTVTESGPSSITIEQAPNPGSSETHDSTPQGPSSITITEGGGNEQKEEIIFTEDENTEIIEEGGEKVNSENCTEPAPQSESVESISFEEDTQASIRDEINQLLSLKEFIKGYTITIEEEKAFEKTYTC